MHDDGVRPADAKKADFYADLGYGGAMAVYDQVLAAAGLTNVRKPRISTVKRARARLLLERHFFRVCSRGDCKRDASRLARPRTIVPASAPAWCEVCSGSVTQRAVDEMVHAAGDSARICVVGGSPATRQALSAAVDGRVRLRLVDGTGTHTRAQAVENTRWADLVVVWGATELDHRVSVLYSGDNVIVAHKRGVVEVAACARDWFRARRT